MIATKPGNQKPIRTKMFSYFSKTLSLYHNDANINDDIIVDQVIVARIPYCMRKPCNWHKKLESWM